MQAILETPTITAGQTSVLYLSPPLRSQEQTGTLMDVDYPCNDCSKCLLKGKKMEREDIPYIPSFNGKSISAIYIREIVQEQFIHVKILAL